MIKICGPKMAAMGVLVSLWGLIQLALMGVFFYVRSPALVEDLQLGEHFDYAGDNYANGGRVIENAYHQQAINCWICTGLYALLLALSGQQMLQNFRKPSYPAM